MFATEWTLGTAGAEDALAVRRAVFAEELGLPVQQVFDETDAVAAHLTVRLDGVPIASARLSPDSDGLHISYICVLQEYRKQGFGDLCARVTLDKARRMGVTRVVADIPAAYMPYWAAFGFTAQGDSVQDVVSMVVDADAIRWHSPCKEDGHQS
jgi:predicted GNAT family N-acyltransferase